MQNLPGPRLRGVPVERFELGVEMGEAFVFTGGVGRLDSTQHVAQWMFAVDRPLECTHRTGFGFLRQVCDGPASR